MGALEYRNEINPFDNPKGDLQLVELVELAQRVLNDREDVEIRSDEINAMQQLLLVGTSAGGARPKAVVAVNEDRSRILSGQVAAPAYDIAFSYKPGSFWVEKHQMTINGKRDGFGRDDLITVAQQVSGLSSHKANRYIDEVKAVVQGWRDVADEVGVFAVLRDRIHDSLRLYI